MLFECAEIKSVEDHHIVVQSTRTFACARCAQGGGCGGGVIGKLTARPATTLRIRTSPDYQWTPGQTVQLALSEKKVMLGAAVVYLLPLAGVLLGAAIGTWFGRSDTSAIIGAMTGLVSIWLVLRMTLKTREQWMQPQLQARSE